MNKIIFDASFKNDTLVEQMQACLFTACQKVAPQYVFDGFLSYDLKETFPDNVILYKQKFLPESIWKHVVPPAVSMFNKGIPFYFPAGNIPNFMSAFTPVISMIKDVAPKEIKKYMFMNESIKDYKRRVQTDINRSDIVFVPSEYIKKRLMADFLFINEPVVFNFASVISDEYLSVPLSSNTEKYFFVDVENIVPKYLDEMLKIFIYSHMKGDKSVKLYLYGDLKYATQAVMININVARKVGAIKEFKNLSIKEKTYLLRNAIAAVFISQEDTMPIEHLNAMRCSCPIITNITPAIQEVCDDAVIYLNVSDETDFKGILYQLMNDDNVREMFAHRGYMQASKFSWDKSAQIFIENIETLLSEI